MFLFKVKIVLIILIAVTIGVLVVENIMQSYEDPHRIFIDSRGHIHDSDEEIEENFEDHKANETFHKMFNTSLADELYKKVRILCFVSTSPKYHRVRARHVKATWGRRCNVLLFMSTGEDEKLPTTVLNVTEGGSYLWGKTKASFKYIYEYHFNDADWFLKANDDTYIILENLRYMLYPISSKIPIIYGCKIKHFLSSTEYMSGASGYVVSKEALRRFIEVALPNKKICRLDDNGFEDVELARCLKSVKVSFGDSYDLEKRERFFPGSYKALKLTIKSVGFKTYCSDNAISFHGFDRNMMYTLEYLIYHLRPFGISYSPRLPSLENGKENNVDL